MVLCAASVLPEPQKTASSSPERVLAEQFGLAAFHPWQREAIAALLDDSGQVLVVAPTGGGKSLCYQLPAVMLPGTTVVISPLIALMEDQVRALTERGIPATFLASTLDNDERRRRLFTWHQRLRYGKSVLPRPGILKPRIVQMEFDGFATVGL